MKKVITIIGLGLLGMQINAQEYYPLPSPCDPDKVFNYLPSAAYDNVCVYHLEVNNTNTVAILAREIQQIN